MSQYVGKLISIVNNEHVRYVGILASISAETSSLVLNNVRVYGTEGRVSPGDSLPVVPREDAKRPSAVFKGSEVSDLQVLEFDPLDKENTISESAEKHGISRDNHPQKHDIIDINDDDEDFATRTQKLSEGERKEKVEPVYNKSNSFFDNLGSEEQSRPRRRVTNTQTFGAHNRDNYRRGGYRGGNRDNREHRDNYNREHRDGWDREHRNNRDNRDNRDNQPREHRDSDSDRNSGYHNSLLSKESRSDNPRRGGASSSRGRGNRRPLDESKKSNQSHNEFIPGGQFA